MDGWWGWYNPQIAQITRMVAMVGPQIAQITRIMKIGVGVDVFGE